MADGQYKVEVEGVHFPLFTDSGKLAMDTAMVLRAEGYVATAWQKECANVWQLITKLKN